jgi:hypothetical protein
MAKNKRQQRTRSARQSRPSIVQKLCAQILAACEAHNEAVSRESKAVTASQRATPKPPKTIRQTKATLADVPFFRYDRRPFSSTFIESELNHLKNNRSSRENGTDGVVTIRYCANGFPLNEEQKARVARMERMLVDAQKYERACEKVKARFKLKQLEKATYRALDRHMELIGKLESLRSASVQDVIAKIGVYRADSELYEGMKTFTRVMIEDAGRELAKAS